MSEERERLQQLQHKVREAGNEGTAGKLGQLLDKADRGLTAIAFCGHFSAGKSTLINRLCGQPLLPSSPIPTSANLVSIRSGEAGAEVTRASSNDHADRSVEQVPLDDLDAVCVNGVDIEAVRITYPLPLLGDLGMLLDTPGIDSTDGAHQLATESALHLADVVLYVMDYNHVQSEINFAFAKKMKDWGKPLYLVVNMIDKHREQELSFEAYRSGAEQAFRSWGIDPAGILFVTTKEPAHPHNEWGKLRALIAALLDHGAELRHFSLDRSVRFLMDEHGAWLHAQQEPVRTQLETELAAQDGSSGEEAQHAFEAKRLGLEQAARAAYTLESQLRKEVASLVENANITPATTRDLAHDYLQSRKPGFKVGLFGAGAKTAAEIERRLDAFQRDFADQVEAQLDWHLRSALKQAAERAGVKSAELTSAIEELGEQASGEWLAAQVSAAAGFGSDYTLNYSRQIAEELKARYRKMAYELIERIAEALRERATAEVPRLEAELAAHEAQLGAWRGLQRLEQELREERAQLAAMWPQQPQPAPALPDVAALAPAGEADERGAARDGGAWGSTADMRTVLEASHTVKAAAAAGGDAVPAAAQRAAGSWSGAEYRRRLEGSASRLERAAALLEPIAALRPQAAAMRGKAARLRGGTFTIALFGAFSAGKSSFANALIGERILPVSPNPTTAAINRIVPPSPDWPHGTARVRMKSADAILEDVRYSLDVLGEPASSMDDALTRIRRLSPAAVPAKGKPHYAFLRAVEAGWAQAEPQLGQDVRITLHEFAAYVADESRSCFVDNIELHYTNELTAQGIIFVDTPGADSINARHTGVAFDYIKNADAILFVTYYNHAFSQADREFLLQLGRVKDSFEMDKMFFIVNAADLASGPEELEGVLTHVETNLLQHGIRRPRLYAISSLLATDGKLSGDQALVKKSGIAGFERDFIKFSMEELASVAVHNAEQELERAVHVLDRWLAGAQQDEQGRKRRITELEQSLRTALAELEQASFGEEQRELQKEIRELLYYVKQRTSYRFGELYHLAFNPASLREDVSDARSALVSAWKELARMLGFDLSQETLATTLRVENAMNAMAAKRHVAWNERFSALIDGYEPEPYDTKRFATPQSRVTFRPEPIADKPLLAFYKNAKHFFEGEGKAKLRAELEARLSEPMSAFVERQTAELQSAYTNQLDSLFAELKLSRVESVKLHVSGLLELLSDKVDLGALSRTREELAQLLQ